jgi:hypothetical protein
MPSKCIDDGNKHDILAAFQQLSINMEVLFARKKVSNTIVGGQVVGMETYRLIFTGAELGNIWRQMGEIEKIINSYMKRGQ